MTTKRKKDTAAILAAALRDMGACSEAMAWTKDKTLAHAWAESARGDWMLWLAARSGVDRKRVVLAACACARTALSRAAPGDGRPLKAVETAEAWARAEPGVALDDVCDAAAAYDAAASVAYAAADAAASAAYADADDVYAPYDAVAYAAAAYAAAAAAAAYAADAADAARSKALGECANLVREHIPLGVVAAALSIEVADGETSPVEAFP